MRNPNTKCEYCFIPIYRRPTQLKKQKRICCDSCKSKCSSDSSKQQAERQYKEYIIRWKEKLETGMRGDTAISAHIRKYLFIKYENKCCKCGWTAIHPKTNKVPLEVNHIDGNHKNNLEKNLELLCPNCHCLTSNYRSLNIGKGRKR